MNGRIALAGDAAHAASPMVGGGFRQGLYDVMALSRTMSGITSPREVTSALDRYQRQRLGPEHDRLPLGRRHQADQLENGTSQAHAPQDSPVWAVIGW